MSKTTKDAFNATGLSHITAVSGSNIVMVISLITTLLLALGFWRSHAIYASLVFIWLYILVIGIPVSGVRAAIMGSALLLSQKYGRQNTSPRMIVFSALLMLIHNPLLLRYDISFQLSFLASLGIIYVKPIFDYGLTYLFCQKCNMLQDILSVTLSAQIFVVPLMVYNFGTLSLVSPLTNILVLPVIPFLTVFGFFISFVGLFWPLASFILAIPCYVIMRYVFYVIYFFSAQSWAFVTVKHVLPIWFGIYYLFIIIAIKYVNSIIKKNFVQEY